MLIPSADILGKQLPILTLRKLYKFAVNTAKSFRHRIVLRFRFGSRRVVRFGLRASGTLMLGVGFRYLGLLCVL